MKQFSRQRTYFYSARCLLCLKKFSVPKLSDFSFGEYLYHTKDGKIYANFSAFDELDISSFVEEKIDQNTVGRLVNEIQKNLKQKVIGKIADRPQQEIDFETGNYICPRCGSKLVKVNENKRLKAERLPKLSFEEFKKLDKESKDNFIQRKLESELN